MASSASQQRLAPPSGGGGRLQHTHQLVLVAMASAILTFVVLYSRERALSLPVQPAELLHTTLCPPDAEQRTPQGLLLLPTAATQREFRERVPALDASPACRSGACGTFADVAVDSRYTGTELNEHELRKAVSRAWLQGGIALRYGISSPGAAPTAGLEESLPPLKGKAVLVPNARDGFWAFVAEERKAGRVLATDWACWRPDEERTEPGACERKGFDIARAVRLSNMHAREIDPADYSLTNLAANAHFDVVLFSLLDAVSRRARAPFVALERVRSVIAPDGILWLAFPSVGPLKYENDSSFVRPQGGDEWRASLKFVLDALRDAGFDRAGVKKSESAAKEGVCVVWAWRGEKAPAADGSTFEFLGDDL